MTCPAFSEPGELREDDLGRKMKVPKKKSGAEPIVIMLQ
jgi:hypothetical protein